MTNKLASMQSLLYFCTIKLVSNMEMTKERAEKMPAMTQIRGMEVGDVLTFPSTSIASIRANLYTYNLMLNRTYRSHVNRETKCIEVRRVK